MRKGSVLRILSATSVAGLMAATMAAPMVQASAAPITLTVTINGEPQQLTLPSNIGPGLYDLQLPATVSGQVVELPPIEFVVSSTDVATLVQSAAPAMVTVAAPGPITGATPTAMTATFTSSGGATTTEAIPAGDFSAVSNSVTFRPPGTLPPGNYRLTVEFSYPSGGTATSSAQSYSATSVDVPTTVMAVNTAAVSVAASGTVVESFRVEDSQGIGVAGAAVVIGTTGTLASRDLSQVSAVTNANGVVTVTYRDPHAGDAGRITAAVSSNTSIQAETGTISVGTASTSAAAASVTQIVTPLASGATLTLGQASTITFEAETSAGAGVSGVTVDLSLTGNLGAAGQLSSSSAVTGAGGIATVTYTPSAMTVDGGSVDGTVFAVLSSNLSIYGQTGALTVGADAPASVSAGVASAEVTAGASDALTYTVRDSAGHVLAGVPVTATAASGGLGASSGTTETVSTNASGVATFQYDAPDLVGSASVQVAAGSATASTAVTVVAGSPARVALGSTTLAESVGGTYKVPVYLADQYGNPILANTSAVVDLFGTALAPSPSGVWSTYGAYSPPITQFVGPTAAPGSPQYDVLPLQFVNGSASLYFQPQDSTLGSADATLGVALPDSSGGAPLSTAVVSGISISAAGQTPAAVVSNFSASTISAGVSTPIRFTVLAADGIPIPGVEVQFEAVSPSPGTFVSFQSHFAFTNQRGQTSALVTGDKAGNSGEIEATTGVGASATATGETGVITVVPGAPATISASFPAGASTHLLAGSSQPVTFTVYDVNGNPVPDTAVTFGVTGLTGYVSRDGAAASSGLTNSSGSFTVTYAPNPGTVLGSGSLWAQASGAYTSAGLMTYTPPSGWATADMANTGVESGSISSGSTVPSGSTTASVADLNSQPLTDIATLNPGQVTLQAPQFLPITSSSGTAEGTGAVWFTSSGSAVAWNLTGEVAALGGNLGYSDFVLTNSSGAAITGSLVSVGSGGAPVSAALVSGTVQEPIAQLSNGTWSLVAPNVQDYWVLSSGTYYQLDVSTP